MKIQPIDNTNFGIYKGCKPRSYGLYKWGFYKDYKIEIYDAYNDGQKLIYVADKCKKFIKSKLIYWEKGIKKVTRCGGT